MKILVGDKGRLALECSVSTDDGDLGRLYLYVNGVRFGEEEFEYEVDQMIEHTLKHFKVYGVNLLGLSACPANELFDSYAKVSIFDKDVDDINNLGEIAAAKYMSDFVDRFVDIDDCVFRYVHYAFDRCFIMLIPDGKGLKLYIKNRNDGVCMDVLTTSDEFIGLWKELAMKRKNKGAST